MRSKVDLPHPEGPTKHTNSPLAICRSTLRRTSVVPYDLRTDLRVTSDTASSDGSGSTNGSGAAADTHRHAGLAGQAHSECGFWCAAGDCAVALAQRRRNGQ